MLKAPIPDPVETRRRIREYRRLVQAGLTDASISLRNEIVETHLPCLELTVAARARSTNEKVQLLSIAHTALIDAIDRYDLDRTGKTARFWTYAEACINGEIKHSRVPGRPLTPLTADIPAPEPEEAASSRTADDVPGDLFGQAVLLAVLRLPERLSCLNWMLTGEWINPSDGFRAVKRWSTLVWPRWMLAGTPSPRLVRTRLLADLTSGNLLVQENAAFAVWLFHAYPAFRLAFDPEHLAELAGAVFTAADGTTDRALKWIAIHLGEAVSPVRLARSLPTSGSVYHVVNSPVVHRAVGSEDHLMRQYSSAAAWISQGIGDKGGTERFFVVWDLARAMATFPSHPSSFDEISNRLCAEAGDPKVGRYAAVAAAVPAGAQHAMEAFVRALYEDGRVKSTNPSPARLSRLIEDSLEGQLGRRLSTLRQRAAAEMLPLLDEARRVELLPGLLKHRSPFVRLSAITAARNKTDISAVPYLIQHIREAFGESHRHVQSLEVAMGAVVRLDPVAGLNLCTIVSQSNDTELRGRAICWLSELRHRYLDVDRETIVRDLCTLTLPARESALNMAQLLLARRGLLRPWHPGDFGLQLPYRPVLWRENWE